MDDDGRFRQAVIVGLLFVCATLLLTLVLLQTSSPVTESCHGPYKEFRQGGHLVSVFPAAECGA